MPKPNGYRVCPACKERVRVRMWGDLYKHRANGVECEGEFPTGELTNR